jgi:hypothetical protein
MTPAKQLYAENIELKTRADEIAHRSNDTKKYNSFGGGQGEKIDRARANAP